MVDTSTAYIHQFLLDRGLVAVDALAEVRADASGSAAGGDSQDPFGDPVIGRLIERGLLTEAGLTRALADEFAMEVVDLSDVRVSHEALARVPLELARKYHVFPLQTDGSTLELAVGDPLDMDAVDNLGHLLSLFVEPRLADYSAIDRAIHQYYEGAQVEGEAGEIFRELEEESDQAVQIDFVSAAPPSAGEEEAPIIRYVHMLITEAFKRRASDIHLEPLENRFRVRYRVDGVLMEVENPPKRLQPSILSRLKLMANISIAEKRIPQDGRIQVRMGSRDIDLRVSTVPTVYGESIVMRILDKEGLRLGLPELGFFGDDQAAFERLIALPDGILLVTGPTGSGKSTTLYSCLNHLNHPDRKIITVEDPVEYQLTGINQVQVRREIGMDFASALRAMLRQAPNVIMIGEIRDLETAEIAINASLTGHMVFSTLHTNDAPSAVSRLIDIGVKPFLVSAALRCAMAQRLVRRICDQCKAPVEPGPRELQALGIDTERVQERPVYRGAGCPRCGGRGYFGRMGLFEVLRISEEIEQMIYEHASLVDLRRKARQSGMRTMREDGVRKILAGLTTPEEVLAVTLGDAY